MFPNLQILPKLSKLYYTSTGLSYRLNPMIFSAFLRCICEKQIFRHIIMAFGCYNPPNPSNITRSIRAVLRGSLRIVPPERHNTFSIL